MKAQAKVYRARLQDANKDDSFASELAKVSETGMNLFYAALLRLFVPTSKFAITLGATFGCLAMPPTSA